MLRSNRYIWIFSVVVTMLTNIFFIRSALCATTQNWQQLLNESKTALADGENGFACFKLKQAWQAVGDPTFTNPAYKTIYKELSNILVEQDNFTVWKTIDATFKKRETALENEWRNWKIIKTADGSFLISPSQQAFPEGCGQWVASINQANGPEQLKPLREFTKLLSLPPIRIQPDSPKYSDMDLLCKGIKKGESKQVDFDLAPFVPAKYLFLSPI